MSRFSVLLFVLLAASVAVATPTGVDLAGRVAEVEAMLPTFIAYIVALLAVVIVSAVVWVIVGSIRNK